MVSYFEHSDSSQLSIALFRPLALILAGVWKQNKDSELQVVYSLHKILILS